jgi:hypothetical protein
VLRTSHGNCPGIVVFQRRAHFELDFLVRTAGAVSTRVAALDDKPGSTR